jgi:hypothetical protein
LRSSSTTRSTGGGNEELITIYACINRGKVAEKGALGIGIARRLNGIARRAAY